EVHVVTGPALVELSVDAGRPTTFPQFLAKGTHTRLHFGVRRRERHENPDPAQPVALLRAHRERPHHRPTAAPRDELAAFHSITSSARPSSGSGTIRPSALAVFRLMISSTFVDCWTGKSAGCSPLRTRPV